MYGIWSLLKDKRHPKPLISVMSFVKYVINDIKNAMKKYFIPYSFVLVDFKTKLKRERDTSDNIKPILSVKES